MLDREEQAWRDLVDAYEAVPPDRRTVEGVVPGWSTHDLVWHCAYWAGYAGEVLERLLRGEPAPEEPDDDDALVAQILATGRGMHWDEVILTFEQSRERVRAAFSAFGDPPELAVQWLTDDTFDHYEEHAAEIRAFNAAP